MLLSVIKLFGSLDGTTYHEQIELILKYKKELTRTNESCKEMLSMLRSLEKAYEIQDDVIITVLKCTLERKLAADGVFKIEKDFVFELEQQSNLPDALEGKGEFLKEQVSRYQAKAKGIVFEEMLSKQQFEIGYSYVKKHILKRAHDQAFVKEMYEQLSKKICTKAAKIGSRRTVESTTFLMTQMRHLALHCPPPKIFQRIVNTLLLTKQLGNEKHHERID